MDWRPHRFPNEINPVYRISVKTKEALWPCIYGFLAFSNRMVIQSFLSINRERQLKAKVLYPSRLEGADVLNAEF